MLKRVVLVLVVTLLMAVGTVAFAGGEEGSSAGGIGVGPTQLLADGTMEPRFA